MNKKDTLKSLTGEKAANLVLPNTLIYFHDVLDHISSMIQRLQVNFFFCKFLNESNFNKIKI